MCKNRRRRTKRIEQLSELDGKNRFGPRERHQVKPRLDNQAECSLRPHDDLREVEWHTVFRVGEGIEVVPANAAENLGVSTIDLGRRAQCRVDGRFDSTPLPGCPPP